MTFTICMKIMVGQFVGVQTWESVDSVDYLFGTEQPLNFNRGKDKRIDIPDSMTAVFSPKSTFILLSKTKGAKK